MGFLERAKYYLSPYARKSDPDTGSPYVGQRTVAILWTTLTIIGQPTIATFGRQ